VPPGVFFERIEHRSIKKKRATPASAAPAKSKTPSTEDQPVEVLLIEPTWTQPFLAYILGGEVPEDFTESRRVTR